MRHFHDFTFALLALIAPLVTACSAASTDEAETGENEINEIREGRLLDELAGVKINGVAVAAPKKIERVLENLGLAGDAKATPDEVELRGTPHYLLLFYGPGGEHAGSAHFLHSEEPRSSERKNAIGSLLVHGKSYAVTAKDLDALDAIANEPRAFADLSYGADKVVFTNPFDPSARVETTDRALVAKVTAAFQADQVPDAKASFPRCPPSTVVTFFARTTELASVGLGCGESATGIIQGSLTTPVANGPYGGVDLDADVVFEVRRALDAQ